MDDINQIHRRLDRLERRQQLTLQFFSALSRYMAGDDISGKPLVSATAKLTWYSVIYGLLALAFAFWYAGLTVGGWISGPPDPRTGGLLIATGVGACVLLIMVFVWGGRALGDESPPFGALVSLHHLRMEIDKELRQSDEQPGASGSR